jgi:hypothetical protein
MPFGLPVTFERPVAVEQKPPTQIEATLLLYSVVPAYNVITWLSPPVNTTWDIISLQFELSTTAAAGTRGVYQYIMDRDGNTMRFLCFNSAAAFANKYVGQYGNAIPTNLASGSERVFVGPCFTPTLDPPCRIGMLVSDFDGTDVAMFHLLVRERTKL